MDFQTITVWAGIGLLFFVLTNIAFFDVARKDFGSLPQKALWAIVALIPFIGFVIYFAFGARKGAKKPGF
ncbi:PLDc N-terminal domain-containing protein [Desulforegula conservatrix]|uniref:PLDc N-terminal domain-containing protein n=1 Tax=Desulforegula conservatrix TaxID=153026 RepID=UPI00041E59E1|nr:PLDc N-terminal domain-containing protein [Desulforegula conservatrix]